MSILLIALTGIAYAGVAVDQSLKGNTPMAIVYAGYALANVGMLLLVD
jgi:hypothetical protein